MLVGDPHMRAPQGHMSTAAVLGKELHCALQQHAASSQVPADNNRGFHTRQLTKYSRQVLTTQLPVPVDSTALLCVEQSSRAQQLHRQHVEELFWHLSAMHATAPAVRIAAPEYRRP
jgi:hypothetical protein